MIGSKEGQESLIKCWVYFWIYNPDFGNKATLIGKKKAFSAFSAAGNIYLHYFNNVNKYIPSSSFWSLEISYTKRNFYHQNTDL